jgi:hypothetical protein
VSSRIVVDEFSKHYEELIEDSYDCVDRIVLNAKFSMGRTSGGMLTWWRALYGSTDDLDDTHLMRMAGRFSRRLRAFAKKQGIPMIYCAPKEKQFETAAAYLDHHNGQPGLFLILVSKGKAPVWEVHPSKSGKLGAIRRKDPMSFVNHYSFHIWDSEWGHVTIRMSGHPPFGAQIILNGHEYLACAARQAGIEFQKESNCFISTNNSPELARQADTLSQPETEGRLRQLCDRWIYSTCLIFALDLEQQQRSGFQYQYFNFQLEYSRNLQFRRGHQMWQVFQGLIDRTRRTLNLKVVKTIFGFKYRPRIKRLKKNRWGVQVETPTYDLTVFHIHYGKLDLKIYSKGESVLRIEVTVFNAASLPFRLALSHFPKVVNWMKGVLERFLNTLHYVEACFIAEETLEQLPNSSVLGNTRVGGLDFNRPRIRLLTQAVLALSTSPNGFTASEVARQVRSLGGLPENAYSSRQAAYDIRKLRAKQMIEKPPRSNRYQIQPDGLRSLAALVLLRDKVIQPLLASQCHPRRGRPPTPQSPIDVHYRALQHEMRNLFTTLGIAA